MKRILLPTDFSENAENAIAYAIQLYKDYSCTFYLLHTYTPISYFYEGSTVNPAMYDVGDIARIASEQKLGKKVEQLRKDRLGKDHHFVTISSFNILVNEIKDAVKAYNIDLIIMGTKGATGAKEIFIGTHTMFVIKNVSCPVIAVPDNFDFEQPKEVVFATNYDLKKTNVHLSAFKELMDHYVSRIHFLHIKKDRDLTDDQRSNKAFLTDYFKDNAHLFHTVESQDLEAAVTHFENLHHINFIVMAHHKHSFFQNLLFKPIIKQLVSHTNIPFMILPDDSNL